jgi:hypothetical protein
VIQHPSDVCSLSSRANLEPVSAPLQNSIRFFRHHFHRLPIGWYYY